MSRKQSYMPGDGFDVIFDGSKSFWKTRSNLDILVALHKKQMCLELVAYNAEIGVEAPRLYMSSMVLAAKVDPESEDFQQKLSAKKEVFNRQKKAYSLPDLTKEVYNDAMLHMILQRLSVVAEGVDLTTELKVTLIPATGDTTVPDNDQLLDFMMEKPSTVKPITVTFTKKAR